MLLASQQLTERGKNEGDRTGAGGEEWLIAETKGIAITIRQFGLESDGRRSSRFPEKAIGEIERGAEWSRSAHF
jgi:hypothetical protein